MIDWIASLFIASSFILMMTFSFCFCFKRDRATYSVSSTTATINPLNTVTLAPLPLSTDLPPMSIESDYEKIIGLSGDGEIHINHDYRDSPTSMEYGGYTKLTPIRSQRPSFDDETQLYATVDKTRTSPSTTAAIAAAIRQGSSPAATTTASSPSAAFSGSAHLTGYTMTSQIPPEHPPPPPPLPPLPPLQVYNTVTTTDSASSNDLSIRRPHYDELITRESLQYRAQRLQLEEQQRDQIRENYYSTVASERGTTTGSELYAEIANGSASGTVHQTGTSHYYSRPLVGSAQSDDLSERYATVIESTEAVLSLNNRIYQEVDNIQL